MCHLSENPLRYVTNMKVKLNRKESEKRKSFEFSFNKIFNESLFVFWWKIAKIICFVRLCLVTFLYVWVSISEAIAQSKVEHREMGYEVGIQSIQTNFNLKLIKLNQITCLFWSVKNSKDFKNKHQNYQHFTWIQTLFAKLLLCSHKVKRFVEVS